MFIELDQYINKAANVTAWFYLISNQQIVADKDEQRHVWGNIEIHQMFNVKFIFSTVSTDQRSQLFNKSMYV